MSKSDKLLARRYQRKWAKKEKFFSFFHLRNFCSSRISHRYLLSESRVKLETESLKSTEAIASVDFKDSVYSLTLDSDNR